MTNLKVANTASEYVAEMLHGGHKPNRLINEMSPYLLLHAFNPVEWYPWGDKAFKEARVGNKPVFLSIGYSTCHWCHVMERESFDDIEVAKFLNKFFVCIKVDREERPDIDKLYMAVTQKMTGGGGWPMSLFLTPDLKPFYAGTYFPPKSNYGRPGFMDLIKTIHQAWLDKPLRLTRQADELIKNISQVSGNKNKILASKAAGIAVRQFYTIYDRQNGGFGSAPKFPRPVVFDFLLRASWSSAKESLEMVYDSLWKMAAGGVYDLLGGGFHRYSVDAQWRVPHFEKMLYDQGQLASTYIDAYRASGNVLFREIARQTLDYVIGEMTDSRGGFFSAEDADSSNLEHPEKLGEGAYYLWTVEEISQVLKKDEADLFNQIYGIQQDGNALVDPHADFAGKNILYQALSVQSFSEAAGLNPDQVEKSLAASRRDLLISRKLRSKPLLDDKILSSWNGLMISALAKGAIVLADERYLIAAQQAAGFLCDVMISNGRLLHRYRDGNAGIDAQLNDYTFVVQGLLDLYEAGFEERWLAEAVALTEMQIELFADTKRGGFYDSSGLDSSVLVRMRDDYDGAEPAGNSVAAANFIRLSWLFDSANYLSAARKTISSFGYQLDAAPTAMPAMLSAMLAADETPVRIVIVGKRGAYNTKELRQLVGEAYLPYRVLIFVDVEGWANADIKSRMAYLPEMPMLDNKATAYICKGVTCMQPTNSLQEVRSILSAQHIN